MTRRRDPHRRDRIARAALAVVARDGVEGLTHRAVASAADVPLGSTTYHFTSREELLGAALAHGVDEWRALVDRWAERIERDGLAAGLADGLARLIADERDFVIVEYELYGASVRRPELWPVSIECAAILPDMLARWTDPLTARALATAADGLTMEALATGRAPDRDELRDVFERIAR